MATEEGSLGKKGDTQLNLNVTCTTIVYPINSMERIYTKAVYLKSSLIECLMLLLVESGDSTEEFGRRSFWFVLPSAFKKSVSERTNFELEIQEDKGPWKDLRKERQV